MKFSVKNRLVLSDRLFHLEDTEVVGSVKVGFSDRNGEERQEVGGGKIITTLINVALEGRVSEDGAIIAKDGKGDGEAEVPLGGLVA